MYIGTYIHRSVLLNLIQPLLTISRTFRMILRLLKYGIKTSLTEDAKKYASVVWLFSNRKVLFHDAIYVDW